MLEGRPVISLFSCCVRPEPSWVCREQAALEGATMIDISCWIWLAEAALEKCTEGNGCCSRSLVSDKNVCSYTTFIYLVQGRHGHEQGGRNKSHWFGRYVRFNNHLAWIRYKKIFLTIFKRLQWGRYRWDSEGDIHVENLQEPKYHRILWIWGNPGYHPTNDCYGAHGRLCFRPGEDCCLEDQCSGLGWHWRCNSVQFQVKIQVDDDNHGAPLPEGCIAYVVREVLKALVYLHSGRAKTFTAVKSTLWFFVSFLSIS